MSLKGTRLLDAALLTLMLCSVSATARYVFSRPNAGSYPEASARTRYVKQWNQLGSEGHSLGVDSARVTIIEFTDYQCPICRSFHKILRRTLDRYPTQLRIVFRHFPIDALHPSARAAALAVECAADQGRFSEMQDVLYAAQDSLGRVPWERLAVRARVQNDASFSRCIQDSTFAARLERDLAAAMELEVVGTPTFLVGDSLYSGLRSYDDLARLVDARLLNAKYTDARRAAPP